MRDDTVIQRAYLRGLRLWVGFVVRHPWLLLALVALSVVGAGAYTTRHFRLNSDNSQLVHQDAPFRQQYRELNRVFPHYDKTTIIVLTAATRRAAADAAGLLAPALRRRPDLFQSVYAAAEGEFFKDHALLYLDQADLADVVSRLAEAQPVLAAMAQDPSLRGLFGELSTAIDALEDDEEPPAGFARFANRVAEIGEQRLVGERVAVSWEEELFRDDRGDVHQVVIVQGRDDFSQLASAAFLDEIRAIARDMGLVPENGVRVRLTGMVPLAQEEMLTLQEDLDLAGVLAFAFLALVMTFGARSLRVIVAVFVTVVVDIVWTAAFGMASVGEFNTISVAFPVLLIGLGVDFAIHLCLRTQEELGPGVDTGTAFLAATEAVGIPVTLCAVTSALGFLSFVPTDYNGLAELGIIAGGGMFLALVGALTVTPTVLVCLGTPRGRPRSLAYASPLVSLLVRRARVVGGSALLLAVAAAVVASRMTFDFSTLGMRAPETESMTTLTVLQEDGILTDYAVTVLAPDQAAARDLAGRLESLPLVDEVRPPEYYLPSAQDQKLEMLEDAQLFLFPALRPRDVQPPPTSAERLAAVQCLRAKAAAAAVRGSDEVVTAAVRRLAAMLSHMLAAPAPAAAAEDLERLLVSDLRERLDWLRRVLGARRVGLADLPDATRRRLISDDGQVLVSALPVEDVSDVSALRRFIDAVETVSSRTTGRPVVEAGVGAIVVRSFYEAVIIASVTILIVVLFALRNLTDAVLVLAPLALAAIFTIATGVLIDVSFNMANIVVVPLVLGLGVDNGIHIVMRFRHDGSLTAVLGSTTPRAIILSGLTTLGAFGAISVSSHPGMRSMGVLLTLAVIYLLISTLIVLPALLAWRGHATVPDEGDPVRQPC